MGFLFKACAKAHENFKTLIDCGFLTNAKAIRITPYGWPMMFLETTDISLSSIPKTEPLRLWGFRFFFYFLDGRAFGSCCFGGNFFNLISFSFFRHDNHPLNETTLLTSSQLLYPVSS